MTEFKLSLIIGYNIYSPGQKFRTFKWDFFLDSLEEIGKLWKWWTLYSGVLQLTDFLGMIVCDGF